MNIISKLRKKYKSVGGVFVESENGTLAGLQISLVSGEQIDSNFINDILDVVVYEIAIREFEVVCKCVEIIDTASLPRQIFKSEKLSNQQMVADNTSYLNASGQLVTKEEALTPLVLNENGFITGGGELKQGYYRQFEVIFANMHSPIFNMVYESLEGKY